MHFNNTSEHLALGLALGTEISGYFVEETLLKRTAPSIDSSTLSDFSPTEEKEILGCEEQGGDS